MKEHFVLGELITNPTLEYINELEETLQKVREYTNVIADQYPLDESEKDIIKSLKEILKENEG